MALKRLVKSGPGFLLYLFTPAHPLFLQINHVRLKRFWKILRVTLLSLLLLLVTLWLLIQMPVVQNWLASYAAKKLSRELKTRVQVRNVNFTLMNHMNLEGLYIEDLHHDTLVYAGGMSININDWFFTKDSIDLKYIGLTDAVIYLERSTDSIWNYQFIADYFKGAPKDPKTPAKKADSTSKKLTIHLRGLDLDNVAFQKRDRFRGKTTIIGVGQFAFTANTIDLVNNNYDIQRILLKAPVYSEVSYIGMWSYEDSLRNRRRIEALPPGGDFPENPGNIKLTIRELIMTDGFVEIKGRSARPSVQGEFNSNDIAITGMTGMFRNLTWNRDTLRVNMDFYAKSREGLAIKKFRTDFTFHPQMMEFSNLDLQLNESHLTRYYAMHFKSLDDFGDFETKVKLEGDFRNTVISTNDLAFFAADLKSLHQTATLNGFVAGSLSDINTKKFRLQTGGTDVSGSLHLTGLPDPDKMLIDFQTPGSTLRLNDLAVWAPALKNVDTHIKEGFSTFQLKGAFKGSTDNFNLKAEVITRNGSFRTDLRMKLGKGQDSYDGSLTTNSLHVGRLLGIDSLGKVSFDGTVTGRGFDAATAKLIFEGNIKSGIFNSYEYSNIRAKGILNGSVLSSHLELNDPNLEGVIDASIDLKAKKQSYISRGTLTKANFQPLHFSRADLKFTGTFDVNFAGRNIDDFLGYVKIHDAKLTNNGEPFSLDSLNIYSQINEDGKKELEVQTNEVDASIVGKFNIADLPNSFQYFLSNYYPGIIAKPGRAVKDQDFIFAVNTKEIEAFLKLFDQKIEGLSNSSITGTINTNDGQLMLNASVPYFKYDNFQLNNANLLGNGSLERMDITGTVDAFRFSDSLAFNNASLSVATEKDGSRVKISTSSEGKIGEAEVDALITMADDGLKLKFNPSSFILNNKNWVINPDGEVLLKNKQLIINNLSLKQEDQEILLYTMPHAEGSSNDLHVSIRKLNIGDLLPYVITNPRLEGIASGAVTVSDPLGKPQVFIDTLQVKEFRLDGDSVGIMNVSGNYVTATKKGSFNLSSPNAQYNFNGRVDIDINDSTGNQINAPMVFNHTRLNVLENYLGSIFDEMDGYASGKLLVRGKFSQPEMIGDIRIDSAKIKVNFTKVTYYVDTATLHLSTGYMGFGKMRIRDRFKNQGILEGGFAHHFFQDMNFDLKVSSEKMELINTTLKDNQNFYGDAMGNGSFELKGPESNMVIKIAAEPTDTSHISITSTTGRESGEADYIVFKKYGREQAPPLAVDNNLSIEVDLKANNKAEIDVVLDAASGDVIKAVGNGRLKILNDKNGMTMKGRYDIERGSYNYSFQSFIRKPFDLKGDGSNYIEWVSGDPMDATLNIDAIYQAKNVRFSDLNGSDNRLSLAKSTANYKGDINVVAELRGKLAKPNIGFRLDFPTGSTIKNDPSASFIIDNINNNQDKSELLKQVTYLIVFNQFAPYGEGKGNRNPTTDLAVNTMSELLSREMGKILSNILYQITGDRSLQVDFSTSVYNSNDINSGNITVSGYDRTRFNFKINKSLANNRIIINVGSDFDFSVRNSAVNTFQFLPDISVEFVLNANRKLRAILFKKDNLELGTRQNRAGGSISYRQDFERLFGKQTDTVRIRRKAP